MKNKIILFITFGFLFIGYNSFAQEINRFENILNTAQLIDPFKSQLPKKEVVLPLPKPNIKTSIEKNVQKAIEPIKEVINPPELYVTGIVWGTSRPQAIINNQVADIGSVILEATVTDIKREGVKISYKGTNFMLDLTKKTNQQGKTQLTQRATTANYIR